MRRQLILLAGLTLAAACGGAGGDSSAGEEATPAAGISLAETAGTWTVHVMNEAGDSTIITYEMVTTSTTEGWTSLIEGREPTAVRVVAVEGDSIMTATGPFESALREGMTVNTTATVRLENGDLVGRMVATYSDGSVMNARLHGVRKM